MLKSEDPSNQLAYQSDGLDFGDKELQRVIASL